MARANSGLGGGDWAKTGEKQAQKDANGTPRAPLRAVRIHAHGQMKTNLKKLFFGLLAFLALIGCAAAQGEEEAPTLNSGDTAWMIVAAVLVLLMTLPGLALFYGGLVRSKNVLSILAQCFVIAAVMSLIWVIFGYSFAATEGNSFIGGADKVMLSGVDVNSLDGRTIPESVFVVFQMTFIIITPALIVGAFAERMKFSAVLIFTSIWAMFSYIPIWHMAWGGGLFEKFPDVRDFAGGTVVHINAGVAGLVACIMLGKRKGFPGPGSRPAQRGLYRDRRVPPLGRLVRLQRRK